MEGGLKSVARRVGALGADTLPAASSTTTVSAPPAGTAACSAAAVLVPNSKLTCVSAEAITVSVASNRSPRYNRALPPLAAPATTVEVTLSPVFVAFSVFATTVPPSAVTPGSPGASGACVRTARTWTPRLSAGAGSVVATSGGLVFTATGDGDMLALDDTSGKLLWRFPMGEEYDRDLKSPIADMKNIGGGRAGSITAAQFLQRFIKDTPWAHLDIAGVVWNEKGTALAPGCGTGYGVRLLNRFIADNYEK